MKFGYFSLTMFNRGMENWLSPKLAKQTFSFDLSCPGYNNLTMHLITQTISTQVYLSPKFHQKNTFLWPEISQVFKKYWLTLSLSLSFTRTHTTHKWKRKERKSSFPLLSLFFNLGIQMAVCMSLYSLQAFFQLLSICMSFQEGVSHTYTQIRLEQNYILD